LEGLKVPANIELSSLAERVLVVLSRYTAFSWPVLAAQCKRYNVDLAHLTANNLKLIAPHLAAGVARFTSPQKGEQALAELERLK
jgi:hypothetical protein